MKRLVLALLLAACYTEPNSDEPFTPLPEYRQWWSEVENCSGRRGDYGAVHFYVLSAEDEMASDPPMIGHYNDGKIWLAWEYQGVSWAVQHEMLHALGEKGHDGPAWAKCFSWVQH